jgi:hypothetical protein
VEDQCKLENGIGVEGGVGGSCYWGWGYEKGN